jgi:hypothetical protein
MYVSENGILNYYLGASMNHISKRFAVISLKKIKSLSFQGLRVETRKIQILKGEMKQLVCSLLIIP